MALFVRQVPLCIILRIYISCHPLHVSYCRFGNEHFARLSLSPCCRKRSSVALRACIRSPKLPAKTIVSSKKLTTDVASFDRCRVFRPMSCLSNDVVSFDRCRVIRPMSCLSTDVVSFDRCRVRCGHNY